MTAWPSIFPKPTPAFGGAVEGSSVRTPMESGRYRQRGRFTRQNRIHPVTWEMNDFEFGMFQSWHISKISNGHDFFTIALPTGGEGYKEVSARFVDGKFGFRNKGVLTWQVTANLEVEDAEVWPEEIYDALLVLGDPVLLELAAEDLHALIHELFPSYF